jgi:hypothetical protein
MSSGDIFYTQVDSNLQIELNARGQAGRQRRTDKDLRFMLEKIANVELTPYKDQDRKEVITEAILGGQTVRSGEYLPTGPNGFLTERKYQVQETGIQDGKILQKTAENRVNSSYRMAPFITSLDVSIGDNSNGLLNEATVNITIPNPERDLNFIESVYLRPGRQVTIRIVHPESALASYDTTAGLLTSSVASSEKILKLYPNLTRSELNSYRKMNQFVFDGLIKAFTLDYQPDMSVNVTLSLSGVSQTYSDLSLIINSTGISGSKNLTLQDNTNKTENFVGPLTQEQAAAQVPAFPTTNFVEDPKLSEFELGTFYTNLSKEVDQVIAFKQNSGPRPDEEKLGFTDQYYNINEIQQEATYAIWGDPTSGKTSYQRYVQLSWLIDFTNRLIVSKRTANDSYATIICTADESLCRSTNYEYMTSANPTRIWLSGPGTSSFVDTYGNINWFSNVKIKPNIPEYVQYSETFQFEINGVSESITHSYPTRIFINMEVIQQICKFLKDSNEFTVSGFLSQVSQEIYSATGGAINMQLITHPDFPEFLLYYDSKFVDLSVKVEPYSIPMFSNHPNGTVVRDFKFSGKLPSDVSSLAYVISNDSSELSESDIAPYVSYMYSANTITRSGSFEAISNIITQEQLDELKQKYKEAHERYVKALKDAKTAFGDDITNPEKQAAMAQALTKYIQYPTPTIQESNQLTAPVIPFETEFTIDGINGFRYGDVVTFSGLPTRYKQNAVFSIMGITHTVGTDGQWTTTCRCVMRPNIDVQS